MIYCFDMDRLPEIQNIYTVVRNTVWKAADPYNVMIVCLDGRCNINTDGENYLFSKGECFFLPPEQSYTRTPLDDEMCTLMYVHFSVENLSEISERAATREISAKKKNIEDLLLDSNNLFVSGMTDIYLRRHSSADNKKMFDICAKISELLEGDIIDNSLFMTVGFCELLALLSCETKKYLGNHAADTDILEVPHHLKKAVWYIKQNYSERITVEQLCKACNMSQSQLTRYFKSFFSTTPNRYITELKINRAKEIFLNSPELSIKNVSADLGFDDQHYFSRIFTKLSGETPSEYKLRVNNFSDVDQEKEEKN